MRLSHLHIHRPISYAHALHLQEALLNKQFQYKSAFRYAVAHSKSAPLAPNPFLLTFQTLPTYTVGRRHLKSNPLSESQVAFLTGRADRSDINNLQGDDHGLATFFPSPRGGLLTYHAPGQLTGFLILDLRVHSLTPRCYIRFLETAVMKTCAEWGVPNTMTTNDPGVWISKTDGRGAVEPTARKICAIGVHVSRGVTSHGIGLNILDHPFESVQGEDRNEKPTEANLGYLSWGFGRIVACGLEGKSVTWLHREGDFSHSRSEVSVANVATTLANQVAHGLGITEAVEIEEEARLLGAE